MLNLCSLPLSVPSSSNLLYFITEIVTRGKKNKKWAGILNHNWKSYVRVNTASSTVTKLTFKTSVINTNIHDNVNEHSPISFRLLNSLMLTLMILAAVKASCSGRQSGWSSGVACHSSLSSSGYFMILWTGLMISEPMSSRLGFPLRKWSTL